MLTYRHAANADIPLLIELNQHLIEDEEYARRFSPDELMAFWKRWLASDYRAVLFEQEGRAAAYALYRQDEEGSVYLRHFFVCRHCRRQGIGREAMRQLHEIIWPPGRHIILEVLLHNERALRFWHAVGFKDHALVLQWDRR